MSSRWRDMTLTQVYPYWLLDEVPAEDIPYIACNDMLAGNMADEIVALAALTPSDLWELERLLPRAFAQLGLQPMTKTEAAKSFALERMQDIARQIISLKEDPHGRRFSTYVDVVRPCKLGLSTRARVPAGGQALLAQERYRRAVVTAFGIANC